MLGGSEGHIPRGKMEGTADDLSASRSQTMSTMAPARNRDSEEQTQSPVNPALLLLLATQLTPVLPQSGL